MLIPFHFKYVFFISIRMEKTKCLSGIHPEDWYKNEQNADIRTGNGTERDSTQRNHWHLQHYRVKSVDGALPSVE